MQCEISSPFDLPDWNDRLTQSAGECVFNTVEWARVLCDTYGYRPCYLLEKGGTCFPFLVPMMEVDSWLTGRRGVGLPFSDFCAPIGLEKNNVGAVLQELVKLGIRRKWRYFEVRNDRAVSAGIVRSAGYLAHTVNLGLGEGELFDRFDGSVRTSIRKAVKAGVEVTSATTLESIREFYRLNCQTRRRHGLPPQPLRFFENMQRHVLAKGSGRVVTAWYEGCAIAAAVFLCAGRQVLFKYGASDARWQKLRASNLVMWEAIRQYAREGCEILSMGRTAKTHDGLRRFKSGWGSQESELGYIRYDFRSGAFESEQSPCAENGYRVARHLPIRVLRWGGAALYRHMA